MKHIRFTQLAFIIQFGLNVSFVLLVASVMVQAASEIKPSWIGDSIRWIGMCLLLSTPIMILIGALTKRWMDLLITIAAPGSMICAICLSLAVASMFNWHEEDAKETTALLTIALVPWLLSGITMSAIQCGRVLYLIREIKTPSGPLILGCGKESP